MIIMTNEYGTLVDIIGRGNRSTWKKTCLSATLSITNPIWTELGLHPCKLVSLGAQDGAPYACGTGGIQEAKFANVRTAIGLC
jgi:hypothetical protein